MKSSNRRLIFVVVGVHVPRDQRQVAIIAKHGLIVVDDLHRFIEALEKQQVVGKIVDRLAILRQLLDHLISQVCRLRVVAGHRQVALVLAHDLRILSHRRPRRAPSHSLAWSGVVRFERRIHGAGDNQRIARRPLESLLVTLLRFRELSVRAVQIAQGQIGHIVIGMFLGKFQEVAAGGRGVAHLARQEAERAQRARIRWIDCQRLAVGLSRFFFSLRLPEKIGVVEKQNTPLRGSSCRASLKSFSAESTLPAATSVAARSRKNSGRAAPVTSMRADCVASRLW